MPTHIEIYQAFDDLILTSVISKNRTLNWGIFFWILSTWNIWAIRFLISDITANYIFCWKTKKTIVIEIYIKLSCWDWRIPLVRYNLSNFELIPMMVSGLHPAEIMDQLSTLGPSFRCNYSPVKLILFPIYAQHRN